MADEAGFPTIATDAQTALSGKAGIDRLRALQAFNARLVCMPVDESSYADVVAGVRKVIGCDACALLLRNKSSGDLVLKAAVGYTDLDPELCIPAAADDSMHIQAFDEEYMVHLDGPAHLGVARPLSADMASALVLPIISYRGTVGVFDFGSRQVGTFGAQEIGMCTMLVDQMSYSLENIRLINELSRSRDAVIRGMALLAEIRDPCIGAHLNRICAYACDLAQRLVARPGFPEATPQFANLISRAAALHDVGKVGIPDAILLKPGKLLPAEYEIMKSHTEMGAELLEGLMQDYGQYAMISMGAEVARGHHEWWNGKGYPAGLKGRDIPLSARILSICDVYDALTSRRVYKDAWSQEDTMNTIREAAGSQFDPELVEIFLAKPERLQQVRERYPD